MQNGKGVPLDKKGGEEEILKGRLGIDCRPFPPIEFSPIFKPIHSLFLKAYFPMELLVFPIGEFDIETPIDEAQRRQHIRTLETSPGQLRRLVEELRTPQLDMAIRPGAWTIRQVIHHLPDAHLHGYIRFRWAMTEDHPMIKTYNQDAWAQLEDVLDGPIGPPLRLLEALHTRWTSMLFNMEPEEFSRTFQHPEMGDLSLDQWLGIYAWHSEHHIAQIRQAMMYHGWVDS